ncbi:MAG: sulfur-oxidizing protein SoxX [Limisphaerales bacterium]|jgi:sulfur-oxidizing protein SoxX
MRSQITLVWLLIGLAGCGDREGEFVLPPGKELTGRTTFIELGCNQCHSVEGSSPNDAFEVAHVPIDARFELNVPLGGRSDIVRSYDDLVTSIINPELHISPRFPLQENIGNPSSAMNEYKEIMTVQQLVDLTTFLQARYSLWSPRYVYYQYF